VDAIFPLQFRQCQLHTISFCKTEKGITVFLS
jgi:hypothetical protein